MGFLFMFVAPSGVGKTTVVERLNEIYGLKILDSYTTRKPRYEGETGHTFITDKEFNELNNICAYVEYNGHRYCSTKEQIDNSDLYVIDPKGIERIKENYFGNKKLIVINLTASLPVRIFRMFKRGDSIKSIIERVKVDKKVFKDVDKIADKVIKCGNLNRTVDNVINYILTLLLEEEKYRKRKMNQ